MSNFLLEVMQSGDASWMHTEKKELLQAYNTDSVEIGDRLLLYKVFSTLFGGALRK